MKKKKYIPPKLQYLGFDNIPNAACGYGTGASGDLIENPPGFGYVCWTGDGAQRKVTDSLCDDGNFNTGPANYYPDSTSCKNGPTYTNPYVALTSNCFTGGGPTI